MCGRSRLFVCRPSCGLAVTDSSSTVLRIRNRHTFMSHAGRYAKHWLEPVALASNRGFRSHELTTIRRLVEQHREFFLEKWIACFSGNK